MSFSLPVAGVQGRPGQSLCNVCNVLNVFSFYFDFMLLVYRIHYVLFKVSWPPCRRGAGKRRTTSCYYDLHFCGFLLCVCVFSFCLFLLASLSQGCREAQDLYYLYYSYFSAFFRHYVISFYICALSLYLGLPVAGVQGSPGQFLLTLCGIVVFYLYLLFVGFFVV